MSDIEESSPRPGSDGELLRLNRTLRALGSSSQAMMRAESESALLADVCRLVVEDCGYAMVWIGYAEEDEGRTVRPVAQAGYEQGYLDALDISWADTERGRGPTGTAIRTGKPAGTRNMRTDPSFAPWREEATKRGYASSVVLPLIASGKAFGALNIYSCEPDAFSEEETKLLSRLAADLAYGIAAIRLRESRAKAEATLRLSEERYRSLFENMLHGFAHCEILPEDGPPPNFRYLAVNRAFERLTGLTNVVGKKATEAIPGIRESHPELLETYGRVASTGVPERFEIHFRPLGLWFSISVYSVQRGHFTAVFDNITEQRNAEEQLRLQATALRSAANGIVITDRDGTIQWVNPAFTALTGYSAAEAIGRKASLLKSGQHPEAFYRGVWETILAGRVWQGEIVNRRKDGSVYTEDMTITPVLDAASAVTNFVAIKQDVTARKQGEARLRELNETLEQRVTERTREAEQRTAELKTLAAELSHAERRERQRLAIVLHDHLQQILVAAKFNLDGMKGRAEEGDLRSLVARVDELLDESIAECRSLTVTLSPTVLQEAGLAAALGWLARRMGEQHGLRAVLDTGAGWEEPADADVKALLFDAARELLFNVVKHSGVLEARIALANSGGQVEVRVEDRGKGIAGTPAVDRWDESTGVGLFFIQKRLDLIGGSMAVQNAEGGGGVRVTLRAPAGSAAHPPAAAPRARPAPGSAAGPEPAAPPGRIRVLLADDHRILRQALTALLRAEGSVDVVGEAADGAEAVELARALMPDVVIMDVSMPRLNGIDATRQLVAERPGTRIIGLSMHEDETIAASMREAGAVGFVTKGGPPDALIAAIRAAYRPDSVGG